MRLTRYLTVILAPFLITGCTPPPLQPVSENPNFCDLEERRVFTQEELDWRAANAPWNLRRDWKTNTTWDRECGKEEENASDAGDNP